MYIITYEWTKPSGEKIENSITTDSKQKADEIADFLKTDLSESYKVIRITEA